MIVVPSLSPCCDIDARPYTIFPSEFDRDVDHRSARSRGGDGTRDIRRQSRCGFSKGTMMWFAKLFQDNKAIRQKKAPLSQGGAIGVVSPHSLQDAGPASAFWAESGFFRSQSKQCLPSCPPARHLRHNQ